MLPITTANATIPFDIANTTATITAANTTTNNITLKTCSTITTAASVVEVVLYSTTKNKCQGTTDPPPTVTATC